MNHPPLYKLVEVLYTEAEYVKVTCQLVMSSTVPMQRRKKSRDAQDRICKLWDEYEDGSLTREELHIEATNFVAF